MFCQELKLIEWQRNCLRFNLIYHGRLLSAQTVIFPMNLILFYVEKDNQFFSRDEKFDDS